jgi:hypothetical protein
MLIMQFRFVVVLVRYVYHQVGYFGKRRIARLSTFRHFSERVLHCGFVLAHFYQLMFQDYNTIFCIQSRMYLILQDVHSLSSIGRWIRNMFTVAQQLDMHFIIDWSYSQFTHAELNYINHKNNVHSCATIGHVLYYWLIIFSIYSCWVELY